MTYKIRAIKNGIFEPYSPQLKSPIYSIFYNRIIKDYSHPRLENGIKDFFAFLLGFFPAETSKQGYSHIKVLSHLNIEKPIIHKSNIEDEKKEKAKLYKDLNGTTWYLYYHEYIDPADKKTRYSVISRLVLEIGNIEESNSIKLYDCEEFEHPFEGNIIFNSNDDRKTLIINLRREGRAPKNLELRIIITGKISDKDMFLGQYIDFESGDKIVNGTLVLENVQGHKANLNFDNSFYENKFIFDKVDPEVNVTYPLPNRNNISVARAELAYNTGWEKVIPQKIATYLLEKWKNFTKTSKNINSYKDFDNFFRIQVGKEHNNWPRKRIYDTYIEYDMCIIASHASEISPKVKSDIFSSVNGSFFNKDITKVNAINNLQLELLEGSKSLRQLNIHKIYYNDRMLYVDTENSLKMLSRLSEFNKIYMSDILGRKDPIYFKEYEKKAIQNCRIVIFILSGNKINLADLFYKIGHALELKKTIFIFPSKEIANEIFTIDSPDKYNIHVFKNVPIKDIPNVLSDPKNRAMLMEA